MSMPDDLSLPESSNPYLDAPEMTSAPDGPFLTRNLAEFRTFLLRGNLVDLAVGIVLGIAFGAVVTALVKDLITPLIAAIGGRPDFSALTFSIHHSVFAIGDFINVLLSFVIIAAVVFFLVIKPVNAMLARLTRRREVVGEQEFAPCPWCLTPIPRQARRCRYCTAELPGTPPA